MKKISILVVEDEPIIADDIAYTLDELGYQVLAIASSAAEAYQALEKNPDLVLLDIKIKGDEDGIKVAHRLNQQSIPFIFLSSLYNENTLTRARAINPCAYIVKPFKESDLKVNIELALNKSFRKSSSQTALNLFVKEGSSMIPLDFKEVTHVQADDNYCLLFAENKKHVVAHTLKEIEDKLQNNGFCRIHKTFLVNLQKIDRIEQSVVFIGEHMLPIGKVYRKPFFDLLTVL